jgi:hypothetical protein
MFNLFAPLRRWDQLLVRKSAEQVAPLQNVRYAACIASACASAARGVLSNTEYVR